LIEELIGRVFAARNAAHLAHWKATGVGSFARHMALGDFYDGIIDQLDKLVESYQGYFGLVGDVPTLPPTKGDIIAMITVDAAWISKNRSQIAKNVPALENIVDELSGIYLQTLYKLKNLS